MEGIVVKGIGGFYYVKAEGQVIQCKARGIFKKDGIKIAIGDLVRIELNEGSDATITAIHERRNCFIRPPIANVDCFAVVMAAADPEPNLAIIDRFLVMAEKSNMDVILCINKVDIAKPEMINRLKNIYEDIYPMVFLNAKTGSGIDELKKLMTDKKCALAGPSGVGKSTILNALEPKVTVETGEISEKTKRGKHTTRHVEIFDTDFGALVFDTPGFTSFEILEAEEEELQQFYPEMLPYLGGCKYDNCRHIKEPECSVLEAVEDGAISQSRYNSYAEQYKEIKEKKKY
ncbi:ribosome small subunit-dependent GTPase A [Clostridium aminobutyricum]|uniref:Small ribosomal subunit biogenesis GTPase RsgA n=1 Tax=Clostridium aminobutyricum TaxID=33953 RepID=A0A939D6D4_CLOAM|nr:ribosome small subunit-dependent GTPase A [Clostridium aminobutyricum]MBN7772052.1 ribosome small subunit-dependent GTPase A [Clostridium aminobutyricum]